MTIHESAVIHPTAIIGDNVTIGKNVTIGPYCLIGLPAEDKKHLKSGDESKGVYISEGAILTGHVTVDGGTVRTTHIGANVFMMKHSHVGHDAHIERNVTISCGAKIGGHTYVMRYANIGLNAVVHQRHLIGSGAMVGMGSTVPLSREIRPFYVYAGNPCKQIRTNHYAVENNDLSQHDVDIELKAYDERKNH